MTSPLDLDALGLAAAIRAGLVTAVAVAEATLDRLARRDPDLNAFTHIFGDAALAEAANIDRDLGAGIDRGPLAGVPFAAKGLFDIAGVTTLAGSKILRTAPPAPRDATVVGRLRAAGAVLVGVTNLDEFAYGFVTENAHYGATHNPYDRTRSAGGSSGGSAAAIAGGLVPLGLGSDTNGSIRVPAAFCGIFGLKPTLGRLSRAGVFPFVHDLDHVGTLARSVRDLALAYDLMQGPDPADPGCATRPAEPASGTLDRPRDGLRVGLLGGWFAENAAPEVLEATRTVAEALGADRTVELDHAAEARGAAFCLTAAAGAALHLDRLRTRPEDFDFATRDRLLAGALMPAAAIDRARRWRRRFRDGVASVFQDFDLLIAPATPCAAPLIGQTMLRVGGREVPLRANLGLYTQPLSFIGVPVVAVPVWGEGVLPLGVQIVAPAWHEARALGVAAALERDGIASFRPPAS